MNTYDILDRKDLLVQLENFKLILEVNSELLEHDQRLGEKISHALGMLGSRLHERDKWEGNNQVNSNTLSEANKLFQEIKFLIERMLNQNIISNDDSLKNKY